MKSPLLPDSAARRAPLRAQVTRVVRLAAHLLTMRLGVTRRRGRPAATVHPRQAGQWAARMLDILDVRPVVTGHVPAPGEAVLIVANHISWLDVQALGAVTGARFVAKSDIRRWPVVGTVAAHCGTVFLKRGSCRDAWRAKNTVANTLRTGDAVAVFPEGTTTDGRRVEPFRAALLQAAVDARTRVHPVAIRYQTANRTGNGPAAFVDDMNFLASLWRVVREPLMAVHLHFGPPLSARNRTRRELAAVAQLTVVEALARATDDPLRAALQPTPVPERRAGGTPAHPSMRPPAQAPAAA